jgi:hypothetical protein
MICNDEQWETSIVCKIRIHLTPAAAFEMGAGGPI